MDEDEESGLMRYSWRFVHRVLYVLMVVGFGMAILGAVGEYLGWWDLVGEILVTVGTIVGALAAVVELLSGASEATVQAARAEIDAIGDTMDTVNANLATVNENVRSVDDNVGSLGTKLDAVHEDLAQGLAANGRTLDAIEAELDVQTGVLKDIRDGL